MATNEVRDERAAPSARVLILERDPVLGDVLADASAAEGYSPTVCRALLEAEIALARGDVSVFVVGIWAGAQARLGEEEQAHLRRFARHLPTVVLAERWWPQPRATALAGVANLWLADDLSWLPSLLQQAMERSPVLGGLQASPGAEHAARPSPVSPTAP